MYHDSADDYIKSTYKDLGLTEQDAEEAFPEISEPKPSEDDEKKEEQPLVQSNNSEEIQNKGEEKEKEVEEE